MLLIVTSEAADKSWRDWLAATLAPLGTLKATEVEEAMKQVREHNGIVIVDATFVDNVDAVVSGLRTERPDSRIVVMTASPTWQMARSAFEAGAIDYLPKTMGEEEILNTFERILNKPLPPWPK
jgi:DNA-binding NtrC family response regulator